MSEEKSLYDRIGGEAAIKATVAKLYGKILDDPLLAPFFDDINVDRLRHSQNAFVSMAFGGPNHYTGQHLRAAHARSVKNGLKAEHFDAVATHLGDSMRELGVDESLITEAIAVVETTRNDVLGISNG